MGELNLQDLPEGCKAHIISLMSPQDACRLCSISRDFKSAAESDAVWDKFLPPDTHTILKSAEPRLVARSKKELYLTLCDNPVLISKGKMREDRIGGLCWVSKDLMNRQRPRIHDPIVLGLELFKPIKATMGELNLQDLPEGCKAHIISLMSPQDACRLCSISRDFKSAAESDAVWDKFLPPDTHTILKSAEPRLVARSKKELYLTLCDNPVLIGKGKMAIKTTMGELNLQDLPEGCKAHIISLKSPQDACRLCSISRDFKSAAESDAVWDKFLPPDTHTILKSAELGLVARSKKELYLTLCDNPVLISKGKMSFSLDKWSGKKCYMISARDLDITWGSTPEYWTWTSDPESRFEEVAELLDVCWLEIRGKLDTHLLSPSTLYKAYLVFKFAAWAYGFLHLPAKVTVGLEGEETTKQTVFLHDEREFTAEAYEFDHLPSMLTVGLEGGEATTQTVFLHDEGEINNHQGESDEEGQVNYSEGVINNDQYPKERPDGWLEIELGDFFCEGGEDGQLNMICLNTSGHWKSGLIVQGIEVRPKRKY